VVRRRGLGMRVLLGVSMRAFVVVEDITMGASQRAGKQEETLNTQVIDASL
jgi:hypothetical protein